MTADQVPDALVVATYGQHVEIAAGGAGRIPARIKGRRLRPVCGDRVRAERLADETGWIITAICPRRNELARPDRRGRTEILAANISLVSVVCAQLPRPDWFVVDRYLAAAELMGAEGAVVYNKEELLDGTAGPQSLADYERIGYAVIRTSAHTGSGVADLASELAGHTAILVGQSGVGKSSLINRLAGDARLPVAGISRKSGEGRHTTVSSALIALPEGGAVIDSPGVRDYAPKIASADKVVAGFREIEAAGRDCRFANCRHLREPDCSVKAGVDAGEIDARRYESYRRLLRLTERFEGRS